MTWIASSRAMASAAKRAIAPSATPTRCGSSFASRLTNTATKCCRWPSARSPTRRRRRRIPRARALPAPLRRAKMEGVPEAPGVYLLYGESGPPLYIGKSRSMRTRVLQHFYSSAGWLQEVRRIEYQRTVGELGALLTESRLVKELGPTYNRALRRPEAMCGFVFDGKRVRLASSGEIDADTLPFVCGIYRSRRAALIALRTLADDTGLCLQALGFDAKRRGACFRHHIGRCAGACASRLRIHSHPGPLT